MYPPRLPDLFQGEQLQVAGRFEGQGPATVTLTGHNAEKSFSETFRADFPQMAAEHNFVAPIWARRKVGYLLDQVRLHGESAEVKNELVKLARDYSIATPYTSLLVIPEAGPHATAVARRARAQRQRRMATPMPPMFGGLGGISGMPGTPRSGMGMMGGMAGMGLAGGGMGGMGGGLGGMMGGGAIAGRRPSSRHGLGSAPERRVSDPTDSETTAGSSSPEQSIANIPSSGKEAVDLAQHVAELKTGARADVSASGAGSPAGGSARWARPGSISRSKPRCRHCGCACWAKPIFGFWHSIQSWARSSPWGVD